MIINLDNIPTTEIIHSQTEQTSRLFIDCGTHTFKAGFIKNHESKPGAKANKRRLIEFTRNCEPNVIFRNKMYKYKQNYTLTSDPQTSFRTLFEKDVIINVEVLEATLDIAFEYLYKNKKNYKIEEVIFITVIDIPQMFLKTILQLFFEVYGVKKVQIGVDAFYSYLWNVSKQDRSIDDNQTKRTGKKDATTVNTAATYDLIISFSHSNTIVYLVRNEKIVKYYKIPYGSNLAAEYLQQLVNSKYNDYNYKMTLKEAEYLTQFLRVSLDYKKESYDLYKQQEIGEYECKIISKGIQQLQDSLTEKPKKTNQFAKPDNENTKENKETSQTTSSTEYKQSPMQNTEEPNAESQETSDESCEQEEACDEERLDGETEEKEGNSKNEESRDLEDDIEDVVEESVKVEEMSVEKLLTTPDNLLTQEQIKEKRRQKMIFYSSIYRYKQKIEKELKKLKINIDHFEEMLEKTEDIEKYVKKIQERFLKIKKDLKTRERIKRNLRNKKSQEFDILTQFNNGVKLNKIDDETLRLIEETEDEEMGNILIAEYQKYYGILAQYCSEFLHEFSAVSIVKGNLFNFNADIEILRATEIFFEPSLFGMTQPGLREIFDELRNEKINNVLITGGFSQIKNMKERITKELSETLYHKDINVITAEDPVLDLFYGAEFIDAFPVYTKDTYAPE